MMKIRNIAVVALALLAPLSMQAQKKKKPVVKKAPVVVVEEPQEDPRITEMREATQQIVFIDSVVVAKNDFLSAIRLNAESGRLDSYDQFFRSEGHEESYVYINEMGNKCYFSDENANSRMQLYTLDKLGDDWSEPLALKGISDGISEANYPFMMTDGTTFYFAAKGEESIGGYDIFVTRYDSERGTFLKAENLGMPFASEANDLFYAIDEFNQLGYFVTDRRQPRGKVCIYTFIPQERRRTYQPEAYSDQQLRSLASIGRIADTWTDKQQLNEAIQRLQAARSVASQAQTADHISKTPELDAMRHEADVQAKALAIERNRYATASESERATLRIKILSAEQQLEDLQTTIRQKEKQIPYNN